MIRFNYLCSRLYSLHDSSNVISLLRARISFFSEFHLNTFTRKIQDKKQTLSILALQSTLYQNTSSTNSPNISAAGEVEVVVNVGIAITAHEIDKPGEGRTIYV